MKTYEEINIANTSYVNKDFQTIWPELLDLTKQLTDRWDPSVSNESDPGVVLLKNAAFVADKINYGTDKNTLEAFLPSATQDKSVRNLVEMNGYLPKYYVAATTDISFTVDSLPEDILAENFVGFSIPAASRITVTNEDNSIVYTQVEPIEISTMGNAYSAKFIQGAYTQLLINQDELIVMDNIDSNYRLYLPDLQVAQNGILIEDVAKDNIVHDWKYSDHIFNEPYGSYVYSLDYDSDRGYPYIQFPEDIASLMGSGLKIHYIVTDGGSGNIAAGRLNTLTTSVEVMDNMGTKYTLSNDNFVIRNHKAATNGKDPENIDQMYQSFKRIVGTFNTLVSCWDYSNAIYNAVNDDGNPLISNGFVTDRREDYNRATDVITYTSFGQNLDNIGISSHKKPYKFTFSPIKPDNPEEYTISWQSGKAECYIDGNWVEMTEISFDSFTEMINYVSPYDLYVYALKAFSILDYKYSKPYVAIENSFKPAFSGSGDSTFGELKENLSEYKCINHELKMPGYKEETADPELLCFKNYLPLKCSISTVNKVNGLERMDILDNVYKAIVENFNAHQMLFGEEMVFEEVESVIKNADPRIRNAALSDFEYRPVAMYTDGTEYDLYNNSDIFVDLVAKNVLAGRVMLFEYSDSFAHDFGQTGEVTLHYIDDVSTELSISLASNVAETTKATINLAENEAIVIVSPTYTTTSTYGSFVNYAFNLDTGTQVEDGTWHKLSATESIVFTYKVKGSQRKVTYKAGTAIRPNGFELNATTATGTIGTDQSIEVGQPAETTFQGQTLECLWCMNNNGNILFEDSEMFKVLNVGEYFITSNTDHSNFMVYGSGTVISRSDIYGALPTWSHKKELAEEGLSAGFNSSTTWYKIVLPSNAYITVKESDIWTFGDKDSLTFNNITYSSKGTHIGNDWQTLANVVSVASDGSVDYVYNSDPSITHTIKVDDGRIYYIVSRFDLNVGPKNPQSLRFVEGNNYVLKTVFQCYGDVEGETHTMRVVDLQPGKSTLIETNYDISLVGTSNVDLSAIAAADVDLSLRSYDQSANKYPNSIDYSFVQNKVVGGYVWNEEKECYVKVGAGVIGDYELIEDPLFGSSSNILNLGDYYANSEGEKASTYYLETSYVDISGGDVGWEPKYLYPIHFYSYKDVQNVTVKMLPPTVIGATNISYGLGFYGSNTFTDSEIYLNPNQMNILCPQILNLDSESTGNLIAVDNLKLEVKVVKSIKDSDQQLKFEGIKVVDGINKNIAKGGAQLTTVQERMNEIIKYSTNPDQYIYWLYEPDKSMVIENDDWSDPTILFDKNNVANKKTIVEVDLRNSTIDIAKAMRDYD